MSSHTLTLGRTTYPVTLPSLRDSRLHVAAVIVTIHVLGQVALRFQVSVPQILAAILTCAVLEVAITFARRKCVVWPASAMLTGSGVGLILRVPSTPPGDHWTTHHWWVFSAVAGGSLLTKYLIRYRGSHVFNPSNIGLVVTFIVLGSSRVEPLDFWWRPMGPAMTAAYAVIIVGGLVISARLGLLAIVGSFYVTLAVGIGVLAISGHCMVARWSFTPVCDFEYWRIIVTSPEVLIFLFYMITDPRTVPSTRRGRIVFGLLVAGVSTLLMAPQTNEFWTKVSLLGGLAIVCACRPVVDKLLARRTAPTSRHEPRPRPRPRLAVRAAAASMAVVVLGVGIVAAGARARGVTVVTDAEILGRVPHEVDPSTFPSITVDQDVLDWNHEITGAGAQEIVLVLAENLQLENQALLRGDPTILDAVDHGDRLDDLRARLARAEASGTTVVEQYAIDTVHVTLLVPFGRQDGLSLGLESRGTVTTETYDRAGNLQDRSSAPFATTFVVRRATGARWLNVAELPLGAG
ncbi:MAG: RnfABCDGE type electron transport complex subunit D [Actinobacteria bacterium]|nr:RnfABCDGE type electron transport complex subunit D [Actinomycetota bacterium]